MDSKRKTGSRRRIAASRCCLHMRLLVEEADLMRAPKPRQRERGRGRAARTVVERARRKALCEERKERSSGAWEAMAMAGPAGEAESGVWRRMGGTSGRDVT